MACRKLLSTLLLIMCLYFPFFKAAQGVPAEVLQETSSAVPKLPVTLDAGKTVQPPFANGAEEAYAAGKPMQDYKEGNGFFNKVKEGARSFLNGYFIVQLEGTKPPAGKNTSVSSPEAKSKKPEMPEKKPIAHKSKDHHLVEDAKSLPGSKSKNITKSKSTAEKTKKESATPKREKQQKHKRRLDEEKNKSETKKLRTTHENEELVSERSINAPEKLNTKDLFPSSFEDDRLKPKWRRQIGYPQSSYYGQYMYGPDLRHKFRTSYKNGYWGKQHKYYDYLDPSSSGSLEDDKLKKQYKFFARNGKYWYPPIAPYGV